MWQLGCSRFLRDRLKVKLYGQCNMLILCVFNVVCLNSMLNKIKTCSQTMFNSTGIDRKVQEIMKGYRMVRWCEMLEDEERNVYLNIDHG